MFEFIICEDEFDFVKNVENVIKDISLMKSINYNVKVFKDYDADFKKYIFLNKKAVIYILSIDLYSDTGLNAAKLIRTVDKNSIIIFLSSYTSNIDLINNSLLNVLTIVSKVDRYRRNLEAAINEAITYISSKNDILKFTDMGNEYNLLAMDILYIYKDYRKTIIKTNFSEFDVYLSLDKIKKILPSYFKQSHRACLINTKRVSKINLVKKEIFFDIGISIDYIGDKYKIDLKTKV